KNVPTPPPVVPDDPEEQQRRAFELLQRDAVIREEQRRVLDALLIQRATVLEREKQRFANEVLETAADMERRMPPITRELRDIRHEIATTNSLLREIRKVIETHGLKVLLDEHDYFIYLSLFMEW
ncbi:hypothetical protein PRIPAC_93035, partial [Pristionchus pacificus]